MSVIRDILDIRPTKSGTHGAPLFDIKQSYGSSSPLIGILVELYGLCRWWRFRLAVIIRVHIDVNGLATEQIGIEEVSSNKEVVVATPGIGTGARRQAVVIVVGMRRVRRMAVRSWTMRAATMRGTSVWAATVGRRTTMWT